MNRFNWYFEQPVTEAQMDEAFGYAEDAIRAGVSDARTLFGVVSGMSVGTDVGGGLNVFVDDGVAYDQGGKRIELDVGGITQDVSAGTNGSSSSVSVSTNERWVSVFAKAGRKWDSSTAATDGNGNAVRLLAEECLNAEGDTVAVGTTPYDNSTESGIEQCYVVVGTEAAIGTAVRPSLITDGVLLADVRITFGLAAITSTEIYQDRRQQFVRPSRRVDDLAGDASRGGDALSAGLGSAGVQGGIDYFSGFTRDGSELLLHVGAGRGYVDATGSIGEADFTRVEWGNVSVAIPPPTFFLRNDIVYVTKHGEVRVVTGTPSTTPTSPAVPADGVPLLHLRIDSSTTHTNNVPIARAGFRRAPFPLSTRSGIVLGCELQWSIVAPGADSTLSIASPRNQILVNGEFIEFGNSDAVVVAQDSSNDPFASPASATDSTPYYIYACKQFSVGSGTNASPVVIIESTVAPAADGTAGGTLAGPGGTIAANEAVLIGVGFVEIGTSNRASCRISQDGWVYVQNTVCSVVQSSYAAGVGSDETLASAPTVADRAVIQMHMLNVTDGTLASISYSLPGTPDSYEHLAFAQWANSTGGTQSFRTTNVEVPLAPGAGPHIRICPRASGVAAYRSLVYGYHLKLPRVGF